MIFSKINDSLTMGLVAAAIIMAVIAIVLVVVG